MKLLSISLFFLLIIIALSPGSSSAHRVSRVVDGDTVDIKGLGTIRLIGVDTPESVHPDKPVQYFAKEAATFLKQFIENKEVRVEYEGSRDGGWGRGRAYLYLADGTLVNAELIKGSYGRAYNSFPFSKLREFQEYEREAMRREVGMWAPLAIEKEKLKMNALKASKFQCLKKTCSMVSSCEEALFLLNECGFHRLDGDKDGIPCEALCLGN